MANFSKLTITDTGKQLLNLKLNSQQELRFTEIVMSESKYDMTILEGLTVLEGIRQRTDIRKMVRTGNAIQIDSIFLNSDLEEGYFANTLGLYAQIGEDSPVLFAVAVEQTSAAYMPQESQTLSGMEIKLKITLENADNVTIQMDQSAMATVGDVLELENSIKETIDGAYQQATGYTDQKIADLINGAPETLDTLGEIAQAMKDNEDVVDALQQAIGSKASEADFTGHTGNTTIHITASERQEWNSKQTKTGDTKDNTISFESGDASDPTGWVDVGLIASGEKHSILLRKISLFVKNVRYLWKLLGTTSMAGIGDGTITGAINELNTGLAKIGTIVGGKTITTNVPPIVETTIATITLSPGKWIIMANVWAPETSLVNLSIQGIMGVMGALRQPQVCGIVEATTQTEYKIICTQWEEHNITVVSPYVIAIRVA